MSATSYLACDLGAESGRVMLGRVAGARLELEELHRFPNVMVNLNGRLHWNVLQLLEEVKAGLRLCTARGGAQSLGIDTWGVDFGLLDRDGELIGLPYCYRDARTDGAPEAFFQRVPRERVYELTGIQVMQINTLYQLYAATREASPALEIADALLLMPDLLTYLLTGHKQSEFTIATTSQLYNPRSGDWEAELLEALGLGRSLMQPIVPPGTTVGPLLPAVTQEVGAQVPVIAVGSHDTASAVAAVPAEGQDWAYLSSGTWSLMGIESETPLISPQTLALNLTNEGGVGGTFRVLKNIMGLWLLQQCRKEWGAGSTGVSPASSPRPPVDYGELLAAAEAAPPFRTLIYPDRPEFLNPPSMTEAIATFCHRTRQTPPGTPAAFTRAILEGLALRYRMVLEELRQVSVHPINRLHVIGGGGRNRMLCQFTADATGLPVIAGPVEATAIGNILVQAMAAGVVGSIAEMRHLVAQSSPLERYQPRASQAWDRAYARFRELT